MSYYKIDQQHPSRHPEPSQTQHSAEFEKEHGVATGNPAVSRTREVTRQSTGPEK